jgi:hypothetical protein
MFHEMLYISRFDWNNGWITRTHIAALSFIQLFIDLDPSRRASATKLLQHVSFYTDAQTRFMDLALLKGMNLPSLWFITSTDEDTGF